ncbi:MAG: head decoration protein [Parvibaculaceae bacterium]|nr:head decoration protein [Parvibaculaceae bacterium]
MSPLPSSGVSAPGKLSSVRSAEGDPWLSRTKVVVKAGSGATRTLAIGTVIAQVLFAAPVIAAVGNTGDGALAGLTLGAATELGTYRLECVEAAANGGTFSVIAPSGVRLADAEVGVAYANSHLAFALQDGATDFIVGDTITITVAAGSGEVAALDLAASDGTQIAFGILTAAAHAPDGVNVNAVAIQRHAELIGNALVWPDPISVDQKAAALKQLAARQIFVVDGY